MNENFESAGEMNEWIYLKPFKEPMAEGPGKLPGNSVQISPTLGINQAGWQNGVSVAAGFPH